MFHPGDLEDSLRAHAHKAVEAVARIDADRALKVPVEDLVEEQLEEFRVKAIELDLEAATSSGAQDCDIVVDGWNGRRINVAGTRVEWHIPFTGESELFTMRPSAFTLNPPRGTVKGQTLVLTHEGRAPLDPAQVRSSLESELSSIQTYANRQRIQIDAFNNQLEQDVRNAVEQRRRKVLGDRELDAALEIPVQSRPNPAPSVAVDPPRQVRPTTVPTRSQDAPFSPEPAISEAGYAAIVTEIASVTGAVERFPQTFAGMPEESLRDVLLVVLNNRFGPASGETFSRSGKTDIFIPYEGDQRAVFIAECKWWSGPAGLRAAIDQLLGYLTWRDTKAALVVFTDRRDPTAVGEKARAEISAHEYFKRVEKNVSGQWAATLHHPDDRTREIHLSLIIVPVVAT